MQRLPPLLPTAFALAMAIGLAACGESDPYRKAQEEYDRKIEWEGGAVPETCTLLGVAEVSRILKSVAVDSRMMAADSGSCMWLTPGDWASIWIGEPGGNPGFRLWPPAAGPFDREALDGIGLEAHAESQDGEFVRASTRTGTAAVYVSTRNRDNAVELLRLVLERLPPQGR